MSVERELGQINAKLESIEDLLKTQNGRVGKLEDRTSSLEKGWASATAIFSVVSAVIGAVFSKIQF
jgi:hypothetical protein